MNASTLQLSIKPNQLVSYINYDSTHSSHKQKPEFYELPTDNKQHGIISYKANKRVKLAIDWLIYLAKEKTTNCIKLGKSFNFKLNFITLTLSSKQMHSDNEIKKTLLNQFLTELRQKYKCEHYLWRAEAQKNGNIHFHVITDVFIHYEKLRNDWNRIQEKLGYITEFTNKYEHANPNSTDVHSIKKVKNLSMYLAKYCSKNAKGYVVMTTKAFNGPHRPKFILAYKHPKLKDKAKFYRQIHGKLWGLSQTLSKYQSAKCEIIDDVRHELAYLYKRDKSKVKVLERATVFNYSVADLVKYKCNALLNKFNNYVNTIFEPVKKAVLDLSVFTIESLKPPDEKFEFPF